MESRHVTRWRGVISVEMRSCLHCGECREVLSVIGYYQKLLSGHCQIDFGQDLVRSKKIMRNVSKWVSRWLECLHHMRRGGRFGWNAIWCRFVGSRASVVDVVRARNATGVSSQQRGLKWSRNTCRTIIRWYLDKRMTWSRFRGSRMSGACIAMNGSTALVLSKVWRYPFH